MLRFSSRRWVSSSSTLSAASSPLPQLSPQSKLRPHHQKNLVANLCFKSNMNHPDFRRRSSKASLCLICEPERVDPHLICSESAVIEFEAHILQLCSKGDIASVVQELSPTGHVCDISLSDSAYIAIVQACRRTKSLHYARRVYSHVRRHRLQLNGVLGESLVIMLAKCGAFEEARDLLHTFHCCSVCSWTAMISGYADHDKYQDALDAFSCMEAEHLPPNHYTFAILFKACGSLGNIEKGKSLHIDAEKMGYTSVPFVGTALVSMYNKCRCLQAATLVFTRINCQDVFSWNAILSTCLENSQAENTLLGYRQMLEEGECADLLTFTIAIRACAALGESGTVVLEGRKNSEIFLEIGRSLHADIHKQGITLDVIITSAIVSMYVKCWSLREAINVLESSSKNPVASWNSILAAYVNEGEGAQALLLYKEMQEREISPDSHTFVTALQACLIWLEREEDIPVKVKQARVICLEISQALHLDASNKGIASDIYLANTLINVYGKCGNVMAAENVFYFLPSPDVVSWNAMLSTYVQQFQVCNALYLFRQMLDVDKHEDMLTYVIALQGCSLLVGKDGKTSNSCVDTKVIAHDIGQAIHARIRKRRFESNIFIINTLISLYGKCGSAEEVHHVFLSLSKPDVVTWNTMLSAYVEQRNPGNALQLYKEMQDNCQTANELTYAICLQACAALLDQDCAKVGALEIGRTLNTELYKVGLVSDVVMVSALVTMYSKCGMIMEAETIFNSDMTQRNLVTWNALLSAYIEQGHVDKALDLYKKMEMECASLDEITLVCALQASSEVGNLSMCDKIHFRVISAALETSSILKNTIIHAYGCCGNRSHAEVVFLGLCEPDSISWNVWIASYGQEGDCYGSFSISDQMRFTGAEPDNVTVLALLYVCSHSGLIDEGLRYFNSMTRSCGLCPELRHYVAVLDLVGRTGNFTRMERTLSLLPIPSNASVWLCLLNACRMHGNVDLANFAFGNVVNLHPTSTAAYILLLSTYVDEVIVVEDANKTT